MFVHRQTYVFTWIEQGTVAIVYAFSPSPQRLTSLRRRRPELRPPTSVLCETIHVCESTAGFWYIYMSNCFSHLH